LGVEKEKRYICHDGELRHQKSYKKTPFTCIFTCRNKNSLDNQQITKAIVEMERFELSSKRGINLLSTCLSSPSLSGKSKTEATHSSLIL